MLCKFESDEEYPVYYYRKEPVDPFFIDGEIELTEEELQDFLECQKKYSKWQDRLRKEIRGY